MLRGGLCACYVEHNENENDEGVRELVNLERDENNGTNLDDKAHFSNEDEFDNEYDSDNWFNFDDYDPELIEIREEQRITKEVIDAESEIVSVN